MLIQKARDYTVPAGGGRYDFSYIANVKALLQEGRDLVKYIPKTTSATAEMKPEVNRNLEEAGQADKELLR